MTFCPDTLDTARIPSTLAGYPRFCPDTLHQSVIGGPEKHLPFKLDSPKPEKIKNRRAKPYFRLNVFICSAWCADPAHREYCACLEYCAYFAYYTYRGFSGCIAYVPRMQSSTSIRVCCKCLDTVYLWCASIRVYVFSCLFVGLWGILLMGFRKIDTP